MKRIVFAIGMILLGTNLTVGCAKNAHVAERAENTAIGVAYQAALEKCVDEAIATAQSTGDADLAASQYDACAKAADQKFGRTP